MVDQVEDMTFVVGGEYDLFQRGDPMLYEALRRSSVLPTRFLMGPWNTSRRPPLRQACVEQVRTLDALALRWFDRYVRGADDRSLLDDVRPVTYFEIGSGRWRTASRWMPRSVHAETYHLDGRRLQALGPVARRRGASIGQRRRLPGPCRRPVHAQRVPVDRGHRSGPGCEDRQPAQRPAGDRLGDQALLRQPVHLMGPVNARLFVHTTARDMLSVARRGRRPRWLRGRLTGGWRC